MTSTEVRRRRIPAPPPTDPVLSAQTAGLRYVHDDQPGIGRVRFGRGFRYIDSEGQVVRDPATLQRIRSLVIPPAWQDVWICRLESGHLQATGLDARGRKQYRYHPRWREVRDENKYERLAAFGLALPKIRARVEADLALPGLPRNKVLAGVVRLLEYTHIRVGNEEYARENGSYGLTTLRNGHVEVAGGTLRFRFRGKSGIRHAVDLHDRRLARLVRRCQDLPGEELFQYLDEEGNPRTIDSADVNTYLQEIAGAEFTAKDFRTWAGTVLAARELTRCPACDCKTLRRRAVVAAIETVARLLGNTRAVCRKCYVHPTVIEAYLKGTLSNPQASVAEIAGLSAEEAAVLALLQLQVAKVSA
jgi:DNA topoisomerase-1